MTKWGKSEKNRALGTHAINGCSAVAAAQCEGLEAISPVELWAAPRMHQRGREAPRRLQGWVPWVSAGLARAVPPWAPGGCLGKGRVALGPRPWAGHVLISVGPAGL